MAVITLGYVQRSNRFLGTARDSPVDLNEHPTLLKHLVGVAIAPTPKPLNCNTEGRSHPPAYGMVMVSPGNCDKGLPN